MYGQRLCLLILQISISANRDVPTFSKAGTFFLSDTKKRQRNVRCKAEKLLRSQKRFKPPDKKTFDRNFKELRNPFHVLQWVQIFALPPLAKKRPTHPTSAPPPAAVYAAGQQLIPKKPKRPRGTFRLLVYLKKAFCTAFSTAARPAVKLTPPCR